MPFYIATCLKPVPTASKEFKFYEEAEATPAHLCRSIRTKPKQNPRDHPIECVRRTREQRAGIAGLRQDCLRCSRLLCRTSRRRLRRKHSSLNPSTGLFFLHVQLTTWVVIDTAWEDGECVDPSAGAVRLVRYLRRYVGPKKHLIVQGVSGCQRCADVQLPSNLMPPISWAW